MTNEQPQDVDDCFKVNFVWFVKQGRRQGPTPADCHFILSVLGQWDEFVEWGKQVVAERVTNEA